MSQGALGNFVSQAQPVGIQPVKQRPSQSAAINLLQFQVQPGQRPPYRDIVHRKTVELVTMDCEVPQTLIFPLIFLVHANTDQM